MEAMCLSLRQRQQQQQQLQSRAGQEKVEAAQRARPPHPQAGPVWAAFAKEVTHSSAKIRPDKLFSDW